ncbi:MAG: hypothetical protein Q9227_006555 [Pyrenula ochraceoflavens]
MSTGKKVFIVGPGFIGWEVLDLLVAEGYAVSALVRREAHAQAIEKDSGASTVIGSLEDKALITEHVIKNDIVFHTATADHLPSAEAVLDGVQARAAKGLSTIFIHTSGTSVLDDGSKSEFKTEKVYNDSDPKQIDSLPDDAPHRPIDLAIVRAQKKIGEAAKIAIMIPPEIYGFSHKHKRLTIQFPTIARFALKHGWAGHVGKGLGVESQINVMDLARAYIVLLHYMERSPPKVVLDNPYFFCENGKEFSWHEAATEIGKALFEAGKIKDPTPRKFSEADYEDLFGRITPAVIGLNSRSRAIRLRELGWQPKEKGIWESWRDDELPEILKEEHMEFKGYRENVVGR